MENSSHYCERINTQFHSGHFTCRVLSNWQRAHASFRKEVKQWDKGENVNTCLKSHFQCDAVIKVSDIWTSTVHKRVKDDTLPEGGGGR